MIGGYLASTRCSADLCLSWWAYLPIRRLPRLHWLYPGLAWPCAFARRLRFRCLHPLIPLQPDKRSRSIHIFWRATDRGASDLLPYTPSLPICSDSQLQRCVASYGALPSSLSRRGLSHHPRDLPRIARRSSE